tara:strand:+ start:83 stop:343 length:261 start_codon:yes stop_codon:yes gene_type:complete
MKNVTTVTRISWTGVFAYVERPVAVMGTGGAISMWGMRATKPATMVMMTTPTIALLPAKKPAAATAFAAVTSSLGKKAMKAAMMAT